MQIIESRAVMTMFVEQRKQTGQTIGFVPTMGALHEGHLTLVRQSVQNNSCTIVSIFVNPTQFNNKEDLKHYPRNEKADFAMLKEANCDAVFFPSVEEMYPEPDAREFDLGSLTTVMEGEFRPGHFNGVVQIVTRLFDTVKPTHAYFGEKDYQQLAVIQYIVKQLKYNIKIVPVPTVREKDGLAMSSRNLRLTPQQRKIAPKIYETISEAKKAINGYTVREVENIVVNKINSIEGLKVEYFAIVDNQTLQPVDSWHEKCGKIGCIAVYCGDIRLIDNIKF